MTVKFLVRKNSNKIIYYCNNCNKDYFLHSSTPKKDKWNFCPNCGNPIIWKN
jgi:DNA-directed RNA polymerase subunit RPC12/RpoP